jgi:hypothetical protein
MIAPPLMNMYRKISAVDVFDALKTFQGRSTGAEMPYYGAGGRNAYCCRIPLGDVVLGILFMPKFQMKTRIRQFGLARDMLHCYSLGDDVVELSFFLIVASGML